MDCSTTWWDSSRSPGGWSTTSLGIAYSFDSTEWQIETEVTYHLDWLSSGNYSGPPNPMGSGSVGAQRPDVLVTFSPVTEGDRSAFNTTDYANFDRGVDAYYGSNYLSAGYGATSNGSLLNPADTDISNNIADGTYWLRIIRNGGTLYMNYSYDGVNYMNGITTTLDNPSDPFNELVLSGTTFLTASSYADYSFVTIQSTAPEPGSMLPVLLCAAGMAVFRRRRAMSSRARVSSGGGPR